jgi:hypothetical protein
MDLNAAIDLIIRELNEAREIIDDLKNYPDVPVLEIELAKSKIKSAGDAIAHLKAIRNINPVTSQVKNEIVEKKTSEVIVVEIEHEEPVTKSEQKEVFQSKTEKPEIKAVKPETRKEKEHQTHEEVHPAPVDEINSPGTPEKKPYVAPIIADTFSHLANRFNEQLSSQPEDDFSYMKNKHWSGLQEEIGINDRFYYIREIFNGSRDSYAEALSRLEKTKSVSEARTVILSYKIDKIEDEPVRKLLDLVKRKFSSHE